MMSRVRFAPSPTGNLHIGTLRTALFNHVFAKSTGATTVLRIEDTDLARSEAVYETSIMEGLRWMGLVPEEGPHCDGGYGPYRQSEREDRYQKAADQLLASGHAYFCFCTAADLDAERALADVEKRPYVYSGKCRHLSAETRTAYLAEKKPYTYKFHVPTTGDITLPDLIRGDIVFDSGLIGDFVMMKSDGMPSYNFAVVVDDMEMAITHVIRGEDHISNTPKQIAIFNALGAPLPAFAHLPMILGPDKSKLSKRHGATNVTEYREQGFLAEAMFNYLSLLGWSSPDEREIMTPAEIFERFSLDRVSKSGAVFDITKLTWMNGQYIRQMSESDFFQAVSPFVTAENSEALSGLTPAQQAEAFFSVRDNINTLAEINQYLSVYTMSATAFKSAVAAIAWQATDQDVIAKFASAWESQKPETVAAIDDVIAAVVTATGLGKGKVYKPIRLATSGLGNGPHIAAYLRVFGQEKVAERLRLAMAMI
jgi:nondiscriminating glutamyl-tRNA synthetase